jgi:hypothetical protein
MILEIERIAIGCLSARAAEEITYIKAIKTTNERGKPGVLIEQCLVAHRGLCKEERFDLFVSDIFKEKIFT